MGMRSLWVSFLTFLLLGGLACAAPPQASDEQVWQQFLAWLTTARPSDNPASLLAEYRKNLTAHATPPDEADHHLRAITTMMRTRQDGWQVIFNNIYASASSGFSTRPNGLLMSAVNGRKHGRALDAGMGQGRNSVFLALKGWDITGFDVSDTGIAIARKDAERAGVQLTAIQTSEKDFNYGVSQWDLIVFTYVPFPLTDSAYVRRLSNALRPGGLVIIESFASEAGSLARRPVDIDPAQLRIAFQEFRIVRFDDVKDTPEWTADKVRLVRMIAEKQ